MERRFFELRINIHDSDYMKIGSEKCAGIYECELVVDDKNNNAITIKVFYNSEELLADKLGNYAHNLNYEILDKFEITKIIQPVRLLEIDIKNSVINKFQTSSDFYEENMKYFVIGLKNVVLLFNNDEMFNSFFYLNHESFKLIELNYQYGWNFSWSDDPYKWEPINKVDDYVKFGEIEFKPEFNFYSGSGNAGIEVLIK